MVVTITDVARRSKTSISTVSRYINGYTVTDENEKKIQDAIATLGYRVNRLARSLKMRKTMTVGVLFFDIVGAGRYGVSMIEELEKTLDEYGYSMLVSSSRADEEKEKDKLDLFLGMNVDGIILMPVGDCRGHIMEIKKHNVPIVLIDRMVSDLSCDAVLGDNINGIYKSVEYLILRGHRDIAFVSGPAAAYTTQERFEGYKRAMHDYNVGIKECYVFHGDYSQESGRIISRQFMNLQKPPSAVLVINSHVTAGVMMGLSEQGVRIPDELSVIGFDHQELAILTSPPLTVVVQPTKTIARQAVSLLVSRMQNNGLSLPQIHRIETIFKERKSVRNLLRDVQGS
jgi:LacI family transcriptional regulator